MKKALLFLTNGFEETEAIVTADILRRGGILVTTVSVTGEMAVTGSHNITVMADELFEYADKQGDMLVLPGGPGTENFNSHNGLKELIKRYYEDKKWVCAICAAPTVLGKLGILNGKDAVCYPGCEEGMTGANIVDKTVVVSGNVITAKGPGAAMDFGFALVNALLGEEKCEETAKAFIVDK